MPRRHRDGSGGPCWARALVAGSLGLMLGVTLLPATAERGEHAGRDVVVDHHRRDGAPDRAGRTGLRRDRAGHERRLQLGQRARRRRRPQDPLHVPRRRLQPGQHGDAHPQAGAAGQHLRRRRVARDADPVGGAGLPERTEGPAAVHRVGVQLLEQLEVPLQPRLAAAVHGRRQDPRRVHQGELRREEDRLPLPGRRVRTGRGEGPRHGDPVVLGGVAPDLRRGHAGRAPVQPDGGAEGGGRAGRRAGHHPGRHRAGHAARRGHRLLPRSTSSTAWVPTRRRSARCSPRSPRRAGARRPRWRQPAGC